MAADGLGLAGVDFQAQLATMHTATEGRAHEPQPHDNAVEAARKFEAYLAQTMLREMRKTVPDGGIFSGPTMETFVDMFDEAVAERIAEGGRLGLAHQLAGAIDPGQRDRGMGLPGLPPVSGLVGRTVPLRHGSGAAHGSHGLPETGVPGGDKAGVWPVEGAISSRFGTRSDPFTGEHRHHAGLDIAAPAGTPIRAVESGEVILAGRRKGYGNVVMVRHDDGTTGLYAHCRDLSVRSGARIRAGQAIATVGESGRATGPHLHFELRAEKGAVDPDSVYDWAGR